MNQCCILNNNGDRCKAEIRGLLRIFIDSEMYHTSTGKVNDFPASWILVPVCEKHKAIEKVYPTTYQSDKQ